MKRSLPSCVISCAWMPVRNDTLCLSGLEELQGFLTAVICTPEMILPSEWLPAALGELEYETTGQARRITTLIMRLYNDIAAALGGDGQFAPLFMTRHSGSGETKSGANLRCRGFIRGMALREKSWRVSDDDAELIGCLLPVLALGRTSLKNPLTQYGETRHRELVEILSESVANLHARMRRFNSPEM